MKIIKTSQYSISEMGSSPSQISTGVKDELNSSDAKSLINYNGINQIKVHYDTSGPSNALGHFSNKEENVIYLNPNIINQQAILDLEKITGEHYQASNPIHQKYLNMILVAYSKATAIHEAIHLQQNAKGQDLNSSSIEQEAHSKSDPMIEKELLNIANQYKTENSINKNNKISMREDQKEKHPEYAERLIESKNIGPYHLDLFNIFGIYNLGIQYDDKDMFSIDGQEQKNSKFKISDLNNIKEIFDTICDWVNKYKKIYAGSMIKSKNQKYLNILININNRLGNKINIQKGNIQGMDTLILEKKN